MALPAVALLAFMFEVFARNERSISRIRELAADRAATEVARPNALGTALVKVALISPLWGPLRRENIDRLDRGLITRNLSLAFANLVRYDLDRNKISARMDEVLQTRIAHPTDSHPPIVERLAALLGAVPQYEVDALLRVPTDAAFLGDFDAIEKELTVLEHKFLVRAGACALPDDNELTDDEKFRRVAVNAAYVLGATIINADGRWTPAQFAASQQSHLALMPNFSRIDFREYCQYPGDAPDPSATARMLAESLSEEGRNLVIEWLRHITYAEPQPSQQAIDWLVHLEGVLHADQA